MFKKNFEIQHLNFTCGLSEKFIHLTVIATIVTVEEWCNPNPKSQLTQASTERGGEMYAMMNFSRLWFLNVAGWLLGVSLLFGKLSRWYTCILRRIGYLR